MTEDETSEKAEAAEPDDPLAHLPETRKAGGPGHPGRQHGEAPGKRTFPSLRQGFRLPFFLSLLFRTIRFTSFSAFSFRSIAS